MNHPTPQARLVADIGGTNARFGWQATRELAPLKKSIYSLIDLREILLSCNQRYLAFLSSLSRRSRNQTSNTMASPPQVR